MLVAGGGAVTSRKRDFASWLWLMIVAGSLGRGARGRSAGDRPARLRGCSPVRPDALGRGRHSVLTLGTYPGRSAEPNWEQRPLN